MREPTETIELTADEAEFLADAISTAYPTDKAADEYLAIADRLRAVTEQGENLEEAIQRRDWETVARLQDEKGQDDA